MLLIAVEDNYHQPIRPSSVDRRRRGFGMADRDEIHYDYLHIATGMGARMEGLGTWRGLRMLRDMEHLLDQNKVADAIEQCAHNVVKMVLEKQDEGPAASGLRLLGCFLLVLFLLALLLLVVTPPNAAAAAARDRAGGAIGSSILS